MTTFVTGAPGWLGTRLVECLSEGRHPIWIRRGSDAGGPVRCLVKPGSDRPTPARAGSDRWRSSAATCATRPICARSWPEGDGGTVFHCAGVIHPSARDEAVLPGQHRGHEEPARRRPSAAGVRRFVHMSSNSPIGMQPPTRTTCSTRTPPTTRTCTTARSKMHGRAGGAGGGGRPRDGDHPAAVVLRPQPAAAPDRCSSR